MSASYIFVTVPATPEWPEEHSEKRWRMVCQGLLTNPLQLCTGPLGVQTVSGSPIFRSKAELFAAADAAGWKRPAGDEQGVIDHCSISALLLGL